MTKAITTNGMAAAVALGHEPLIIIKVDWSAGTKWYADKFLSLPPINAEGRIVSMGQLNGQKKQDAVGAVTQIAFSLFDDDGQLKQRIDSSNVEYTKVTVFQHFQGLAYADLSTLFVGYIAGPITWSEGSRQFSFSVETRLKDQVVGFSVDYIPPADPNNIYALPNPSVPFLNPNAVEKAWPLAFGDVVHVPALLLQTAPRGFLKYPFRGPRVPPELPTTSPYKDDTHFYLIDGDGAYFPQDTIIQVEIDGYIFSGIMHQDTFTVSEHNLPKYENVYFGPRDPNDPDTSLGNVAWLLTPISIVNNWCLYQDEFGGSTFFRCVRQEAYYDADGNVWYKVAFDTPIFIPASGGVRLFGATDKILQVAKHGREGWSQTSAQSVTRVPGVPSQEFLLQTIEVLSHITWRINAGAEVRMWKPFRADVFVTNLVASNSIVGVWADRTNKEGVKELVPINPAYYTVQNGAPFKVTNLDGLYTKNPTLITFDPPLREYEGQKWGDQVFVTLKSSLRNNTADQVKYLFDNWSILPTDPTTFTAVHTSVQNYPSNFVLFDKYGVVDIAQKVCWCARMALVLDDGIVKVKYLSARPSADTTYGEANTLLKSLGLSFTSTEDIYTELHASYTLTYYPAKRYHKEYVYKSQTAIAQYGIRRRNLDFFIYNIPSLVKKSMDFWGYRIVNSWRKVRGRFGLEAIKLEMFDAASLNYADTTLLNGASILSTVDAYSVNTDDDTVDLDLWLPYVAGSTTEAAAAWTTDGGDTFPYDPTQRYLPTPNDLQIADEESRFLITKKIVADGSPKPAIVTAIVPNLSGL